MLKKIGLVVGAAAMMVSLNHGLATAQTASQAVKSANAAGCYATWHGETTNFHQRLHLRLKGCGPVEGVLVRMEFEHGWPTDCKPLDRYGYTYFDIPATYTPTRMSYC